jgi:hypothetical protein
MYPSGRHTEYLITLQTKDCAVSKILRDIYDINGMAETLEAATDF